MFNNSDFIKKQGNRETGDSPTRDIGAGGTMTDYRERRGHSDQGDNDRLQGEKGT